MENPQVEVDHADFMLTIVNTEIRLNLIEIGTFG